MTTPQLNRLIQELLDGRISAEELPILEAELEASEDARELYLDTVEIHSFLTQQEMPSALKRKIVPMDRILRRQKRRSLRVAMLAAAAVLLLALVAMRMFFIQPTKQQPLVFTTAPGTQFTLVHGGSDNAPEGRVLVKGSQLQLTQGTVELTFGSGVKSIVTAPAHLTLHGHNTLYMNQGTAWFHVPKEAIGFQVKTKDLNIVDLGTEFGVLASPNNHDELHVFKGKVKVTAKRVRKESATLIAGQARRIDPVGRLTDIPVSSRTFLTKLPRTLPYLHWAFDGTEQQQLEVTGSIRADTEIISKMKTEPGQTFTTKLGKFGNALSSIGNGSIQTNWDGISGNRPRTVAYWIKLPDSEAHYFHPIVSWGMQEWDEQTSSTRELYTFVDTRQDSFITVTGLSLGAYWITGTTSIADNQWHHIAYVYNGKSQANGDPKILCYVDGQVEATTRHTYADAAKNSDGKIIVNTVTDAPNSYPVSLFGRMWNIAPLEHDVTRLLDELYIFQGALSEEEILNLYQNNQLHSLN